MENSTILDEKIKSLEKLFAEIENLQVNLYLKDKFKNTDINKWRKTFDLYQENGTEALIYIARCKSIKTINS